MNLITLFVFLIGRKSRVKDQSFRVQVLDLGCSVSLGYVFLELELELE